jgi:hypothetical protein
MDRKVLSLSFSDFETLNMLSNRVVHFSTDHAGSHSTQEGCKVSSSWQQKIDP